MTQRGTASSRLASGSIMVPELLPSSRVTFLRPARRMIVFANRWAAGERDLAHPRVGNQPVADGGAGTHHDVEDARGKSGFLQNFAQAEGRQEESSKRV